MTPLVARIDSTHVPVEFAQTKVPPALTAAELEAVLQKNYIFKPTADDFLYQQIHNYFSCPRCKGYMSS